MILGIYGYQDSGKTVTVEKLVSAIVKRGYMVASVKHAPHRRSIDSEGKDTWRHWKAGSDPVVFSSETETTVIRHSKMSAQEIASMLMTEFHPDLVVLEGFKEGPFPKVAMGSVRPREGTVMVNPKVDKLVEYVVKEIEVEKVLARLPRLDCRKCGLSCEGLARAVVEGGRKITGCVELSSFGADILVNGKAIPMGKFASEIVDSTLRGMLRSLKGYEEGGTIDIRLEGGRKRPAKVHRK